MLSMVRSLLTLSLGRVCQAWIRTLLALCFSVLHGHATISRPTWEPPLPCAPAQIVIFLPGNGCVPTHLEDDYLAARPLKFLLKNAAGHNHGIRLVCSSAEWKWHSRTCKEQTAWLNQGRDMARTHHLQRSGAQAWACCATRKS